MNDRITRSLGEEGLSNSILPCRRPCPVSGFRYRPRLLHAEDRASSGGLAESTVTRGRPARHRYLRDASWRRLAPVGLLLLDAGGVYVVRMRRVWLPGHHEQRHWE